MNSLPISFFAPAVEFALFEFEFVCVEFELCLAALPISRGSLGVEGSELVVTFLSRTG